MLKLFRQYKYMISYHIDIIEKVPLFVSPCVSFLYTLYAVFVCFWSCFILPTNCLVSDKPNGNSGPPPAKSRKETTKLQNVRIYLFAHSVDNWGVPWTYQVCRHTWFLLETAYSASRQSVLPAYAKFWLRMLKIRHADLSITRYVAGFFAL